MADPVPFNAKLTPIWEAFRNNYVTRRVGEGVDHTVAVNEFNDLHLATQANAGLMTLLNAEANSGKLQMIYYNPLITSDARARYHPDDFGRIELGPSAIFGTQPSASIFDPPKPVNAAVFTYTLGHEASHARDRDRYLAEMASIRADLKATIAGSAGAVNIDSYVNAYLYSTLAGEARAVMNGANGAFLSSSTGVFTKKTDTSFDFLLVPASSGGGRVLDPRFNLVGGKLDPTNESQVNIAVEMIRANAGWVDLYVSGAIAQACRSDSDATLILNAATIIPSGQGLTFQERLTDLVNKQQRIDPGPGGRCIIQDAETGQQAIITINGGMQRVDFSNALALVKWTEPSGLFLSGYSGVVATLGPGGVPTAMEYVDNGVKKTMDLTGRPEVQTALAEAVAASSRIPSSDIAGLRPFEGVGVMYRSAGELPASFVVVLPEGISVGKKGEFKDDFGRLLDVTFDATGRIMATSTTERGVTVTRTFDPAQNETSSKIKINAGKLINFNDAGAALGQQLGLLIAGDNKVAGVVASATLKTVGGALGKALDGAMGGKSVTKSVKDAVNGLGTTFAQNLMSAGIGAVSSYLTAELVRALDVRGVPGELLGTAAGSVINTMIGNIVLEGAKTAAEIFKGVGSAATLGNAIGAYVGSKLASELVTFGSVGGQLGSAVGSILGSLAGVAIGKAVFGSLGTALAGPLGAAIGTFVGTLVGGALGSLLGGTPRSGADVEWDPEAGGFVAANVYSKNKGSKAAARDLATVVAHTFNNILAATGGTLMSPEFVQTGNYGMRKLDYVYRPTSTRDKDAITQRFSGKDAPQRLVGYGLFQGLTDPDFKIAGGDVYVKRALYNTFENGGLDPLNFDAGVILGNITFAQRYESYLENALWINSLLASEGDSVFAAEIALTLAKAVELGLTRRHESDWYGGFTQLLADAHSNAGQASLGFDYDLYSGRLARVIQIGDVVVSDTIDVAGQTEVTGTARADRIVFSAAALDAASATVNVDLEVDGKAHGAEAAAIDVAATVYAGAGDDRVQASNRGDNVFGGDGDDKLYGGVLDDWLLGGDGNDQIHAGNGSADLESGGTGLGGDGNYLDGGDGNDRLIGREGSDWLEGGEGDDFLDGGAGDDILAGGGGLRDDLKGGHGNDQYVVRLGDGKHVADEVAAGAPASGLPGGTGDVLRDRAKLLLDAPWKRNWAGSDEGAAAAGTASVADVTAGGEDSIVFGAGIGMGDIKLVRSQTAEEIAAGATTTSGRDLIIKVMGTYTAADATTSEFETGTQITVTDWFVDSLKRIEWLRFADGNEVRIGDIENFIIGTSGNDIIKGTAGRDFAWGGGGNDHIHLGDGDDIGNGGTGDDAVWGDNDRDLVIGGLGRDKLYGGQHDDVLSGDAGDDELMGEEGHDLLSGGRGNDILSGGAGRDTIKFARGDGRDTILVEPPVAILDRLDPANWRRVWGYGDGRFSSSLLVKGKYYEWFDTASGGRELREYVGQTTADLHVASDAIEFGLDIDIQDISLARFGKDLVLVVADENAENTSLASARDTVTIKDWYTSDNAADSSTARPVDRFAFYNTGILDVGTGSWTLVAGTDEADGAGSPLLGTIGNDWITGGGGDDVISGGTGEDIINGNGGDDELRGGAGNNVLYGGAGNDVLVGGAGAQDMLIGGAGLDTASYEGSGGVTAYLGTPGLNEGDARGDTYVGIENLQGSANADHLVGDEGDNVIAGGAGKDTLRGEAGDDVYSWNAGDGHDTFVEGVFEPVAVMTAGVLSAGYAVTAFSKYTVYDGGAPWYYQLQISGPEGVVYSWEDVSSQSFNAANYGAWPEEGWQPGYHGGGGDAVREQVTIAAAGDDTIELGAGISLADLTFEKAGSDLIIRQGADGSMTVRNQFGAGGQQRIEKLQFADGQTISIASVIAATGTDPNAAVDPASPVGHLVAGDARSNVLDGGAGDDVLSGGAESDTLRGGAGDDILEGGSGADTIDGGAHSAAAEDPTGWGDTVRYASSAQSVSIALADSGAAHGVGGDAAGDVLSNVENITGSNSTSSVVGDILTGNSGGNRLLGLAGNDELKGLGGDDVLAGGSGLDALAGGDGADNLDGGDDSDILGGDAGDDVLLGGAGDDELSGGAGNDNLMGGDDNDRLYGGAGNDFLDGGAGDDELRAGTGGAADPASKTHLTGGAGADRLFGAAGDDTLEGGGDNDELQGGLGNDTYLFDARSGADTILDAGGTNRIVFAGVAQDQLWLTRSGDGSLHIRVLGAGGSHVTVLNHATAGIREIVAGSSSIFLNSAAALIDAMSGVTPVPQSAAEVPQAIAADRDALWVAGGKAAPTVADQSYAVSERSEPDGPVTSVNGSVGARDLDADITGYAVAAAPQKGTLHSFDAAAGTWQYRPNPYANGTDSFRVRVTDAGGHVVEQQVTIEISPVNSRPTTPLVGAGGAVPIVSEGAVGGTVIAELGASDPDGVNPDLRLRLRGDSSAIFRISGNRLVLADGLVFDYQTEARPGVVTVDRDGDGYREIEFTAYVESFDGALASPGAATIVVGIEDTNAAPTDIDLAGSSVDERDRPQTVVATPPAVLLGTLSAVDSDGAPGEHVFSLVDPAGKFELVDNNKLYLKAGAVLDYETAAVDAAGRYVGVAVKVTDRNGAGKSLTETLRIAINDLPDYFYGTAGADDIAAAAGRDLVFGRDGDDILRGASGHDDIFGEAGSDRLHGDDGDDVLEGGLGADILVGGAGTDRASYADSSVGVTVDLTPGADGYGTGLYGTAQGDKLIEIERLTGSSHADTLTGAGLAHVLDGGAGDDTLTGGAGSNSLIGGAGADTLVGGTGSVSLAGGAGDDTYSINGAAQAVTENQNEGIDTVKTMLLAYTLGDHVENLTFVGTGNFAGRGNSANNRITGGAGSDALYLNTGGDDVVEGGAGNDNIFFGSALTGSDTVSGGIGEDTIVLQGNYGAGLALGTNVTGIESIAILGGHNALFGQVGTYAYKITIGDGNLNAGASGFAKINGSSLQAGESQTFDGSAESDVRLLVYGSYGTDTFTGGARDDVFFFADGNRFGAADKVTGGLGNDVLWLRGDYAIDFNAAGFAASIQGLEELTLGSFFDTRYGAGGDGEFDYSVAWNNAHLAPGQTMVVSGAGLGANEEMIFDGSRETDGMLNLAGGAGNDRLTGGNGADTLTGGAGDDVLAGGTGYDSMAGGAGNDTYEVDNAGDKVTENPNEGTDLVKTSLTSYALGADVENLTYTGSLAFTGTGNDRDNVMTGGAGADWFFVQSGGNDTIHGGAGNDVVFFGAFMTASDQFLGGAGSDQLGLQGNYALTLGAGIVDVESLALLDGGNRTWGDPGTNNYSYDITTLDSNVAAGGELAVNANSLRVGEKLTFNGGAETNGSFRVYSGAGDDKFTMGAGNDTIYGGAGLDWFYLQAGGNDTAVGGAGTDVFIFGGTLTAADSVDGGADRDQISLQGDYASTPLKLTAAIVNVESLAILPGAGTTYYSYNITTVDENVAAGVQLTADASQLRAGEHLTFNGAAEKDGSFRIFGAAGNDTLTGGAGNDTITSRAGNDILSGGSGADAMTGGAGDDIYVVDNVGDSVVELASEGTDLVRTTLGSYSLSANVDNLTFVGTGSFVANGNDLSNVLTSASGNDTIAGGLGADKIIAGGHVHGLEKRMVHGRETDVLRGGDTATYASSASVTGGPSEAVGAVSHAGFAVSARDISFSGVRVNLAANSSADPVGFTGATGAGGGEAEGDRFSGIENVTGSAFGDRLEGDGGRNELSGNSGDDLIYGGAGDDLLSGDLGNDVIYGQGGRDEIWGGGGDDRLFGDDDQDELFGEAGMDILQAGSAGDKLDGGADADTLIGANGGDTYIFGRGSGKDVIYNYDDDNSRDAVQFLDDVGYTNLWFVKEGKDLVIKILGTGGNDRLTVKDWFETTDPNNYKAADRFYIDALVAGRRWVGQEVNVPALLALMTGPEPASFEALSPSLRSDIDAAWLENTAPVISSASVPGTFEAPEVGAGYAYGATGSPVTFGGATGVAGHGSAWSFSAPADGDQVAFLQGGTGSKISLPVSGLSVGSLYAVNFHMATRPGFAPTPLEVSFVPAGASSGIALGTYTPSTGTFTSTTSVAFNATAASGTLTFTATAGTSAYNSGLDKVSIVQAGGEDGVVELRFNIADGQSPPAGLDVKWSVTSGDGQPVPIHPILTSDWSYDPANEEIRILRLRTVANAHGLGTVTVTASDWSDPNVVTTYSTNVRVLARADDVKMTGAINVSTGLNATVHLPSTLTGGKLAEIQDTNSEVFDRVTIENVPVGATLWDGIRSFTATASNRTASIKDWNLAALYVTPAAGSASDFTMTLRAASRENLQPFEILPGAAVGKEATATIKVVVNAPPTDVTMRGLGTAATPTVDEFTPTTNPNGKIVGVATAVDPDALDANRISTDFNLLPTYGHGEERIITAVGPNGTPVQVLETGQFNGITDGSGGGVGWASAGAPDTTKAYKYTVYVKAENLLGHTLYIGTLGQVENATTGAADPNPYFATSNSNNVVQDRWYRVEGWVLPAGHALVGHDVFGGVFDTVTGEKIANSYAFRFAPGATATGIRFFSAYGEERNGYSAQWYLPQVEKLEHLYTFENNATATSDGRFKIDAATGLITATGTNFDYEALRSHTIKVRATDATGLWTERFITIGVNNINERPLAPELLSKALHSETFAGGAAHPGQVIATFKLTDPDLTVPALRIVGGNPHGWFAVNGNQLVFGNGNFTADWLRGNAGLHGTDAAWSYDTDGDGLKEIRVATLTLDASDGALAGGPVTFDVLIENVNERPNAVVTETKILHSEVVPGAAAHPGQVIATFKLSDPDGTTPALRITGGNPYGWFATSGNQLSFGNANFTADWLRANLGTHGIDAAWSYDTDGDGLKEIRVATLTLEASDGSLSGAASTFDVLIEDRNEAPLFNASAFDLPIDENAGYYQYLGAVAGRDLDGPATGPASELRYTFTGRQAYVDGALGRWVTSSPDQLFVMDTLDGRIWKNGTAVIDRESTPSLSYQLSISDRSMTGNHVLSGAATLRVAVGNLNDNAPAMPTVQAWGTTAFAENTGAGYTLAQLSAPSDPDGTLNPLSYQLTANPDNLFEIYGQTLRMRTDRTPNYETFASGGASTTITVRFRTTDGHLVSPENAISVVIHNNTNEFAAAFTQLAAPFTVAENTPYGTVVSDGVRAVDPDGGAITYSIDQATNPNGAFGINAAGQITIANGVDYEQANWLADGAGKYANLRILASDGNAAAETSVQVRITNQILTVRHANGALSSRYREEWTSTRTGEMVEAEGPSDRDGGHTGWTVGGAYSWYTEHRWIDNLTEAVIMTDGAYGSQYQTTNRPVPHPSYWNLAPGFYVAADGSVISDEEHNGWSVAPIVFDLAGAGLDAAFGTQKVAFDVQGDGRDEQVRWLASGFGFLALDRNGDGRIGSGLEISFTQDKAGAKTDLEGLAAFDSNADGNLSAADLRFGEFLLWQDANADGKSQAAELKTLSQAGIASLSLTGTPTGRTYANTDGNVILNTAAFAFANGTQGKIGDAVLRMALADGVPAAQAAPALTFAASGFSGKSGKYLLSVEGGVLSVGPAKAKGALDTRAGAVGPAAMLDFRNRTIGMLGPIVLDLDGDGLEIKSIAKARARFDMDGNGAADDTGWIGRNDGFLVADLDGDGRVGSPAELSLLGLKTGARNSLEALAALDSNRDGKIDAGDARFGELKIWRDSNGNGVSDAGELAALGEHGIASIGLDAQSKPATAKVGENILLATSTFTRTDGSTGTAGDVALAFRPASSPQEAGDATGLDARLGVLRSVLDRFGQGSGPALPAPAQAARQEAALEGAPLAAAADAGQRERLARIVQQMASFGSRSAASEWTQRASNIPQYDYFAS